MGDVQSGLAALTATGWDVTEPNEGGRFGDVGVRVPFVGAAGYNGGGQVTSFTRDGLPYTVNYPNATTVVVAGNGKTLTYTLDGSGRYLSGPVIT